MIQSLAVIAARFVGARPGLVERAAAGAQHRIPEVLGIVLDPAAVGIVSRELLLGAGDDPHFRVDDNKVARCGALVDRRNVAHGSLTGRELQPLEEQKQAPEVSMQGRDLSGPFQSAANCSNCAP